MTVGPPFMYTIPNFEALAVEYPQIRVERTVESGEAERYDAFIRNDSGLSRNYPAALLRRKYLHHRGKCMWGGSMYNAVYVDTGWGTCD